MTHQSTRGTITPEMTFAEIAEEISAWATEKGFWDVKNSWLEECALFHSELSEAAEHWRNGHEPNEIFTTIKDSVVALDGTQKPDGIPIEIADYMIRVLDSIGHHKLRVIDKTVTGPSMNFAKCKSFLDHISVMHFTTALGYMMGPDDDRDSAEIACSRMLRDAINLSRKFNIDYMQAIMTKMTYNMTRPIRHGGKRA